MKIKIRRRSYSDFSETGVLSDLAFLLLIFFLAAGTFLPVWGFQNTSGSVKNQEKEYLEIELTEAGFRIDGKEVSTFMAGHRAQEANNIILSVHPEVTYQNVISAIDILKKSGTGNISIRLISEPPVP